MLATVLGLGSYYEASDDTALAWLFSGVTAAAPVSSVPLYFHGYGQALAALYAAAPGLAWFGLLLGVLLGAATAFAFAVLHRLLQPYLQPKGLVLALAGFFVLAWLEHWLWFSYVRVALLLAGAAVLYAAQRPASRRALALGLLGLGAAWLMRPSLAQLGFGAVLPAALLLAGGWRRAVPLVASGALLLVLAAVGGAMSRTPAQAHTQQFDGYLARILDFNQLQPSPRNAVDSLGTAAVSQWMLGDSVMVNAGLCERAYRFDARHFVMQEVPAKLATRVVLLGQDYFPLWLALAASAWWVRPDRRGWFWLVQAGFAGVLLLFAGVLKLPPRLALPLLDFWLFTNLALALPVPRATPYGDRPGAAPLPLAPAGPRRAALAVLSIAALLYGAKIWHRQRVLSAERHRHEQALAAIDSAGMGRVRILAGTNDLLKSLSPFRLYTPNAGQVLMLTGWPSHDASQRRLRHKLSGGTDQTECLRRLAAAAPGRSSAQAPLWVLSGEGASWLQRRFQLAGLSVQLTPGAYLPADSTLRFYQVLAR